MILAAHHIRTHLDELAAAITDGQFALRPDLLARYGDIGRVRCLEDARFHLQYLATALEAKKQEMFLDYVAWTKIVLARRGVPESDLAANLDVVAAVIAEFPEAVAYVRGAIEELPSMPDDVVPFLDPRAPLWHVADSYLRALLAGDRREAEQLVTRALDGGASLGDIYRRVFEPSQREVGRLWQLNRINVAQEHFCSAATQQIMTRLYGRLFSEKRPSVRTGRVVAMCVGNELHEIGLRIVTDLLELDGWQTWYLGASMPAASAIQLCIDQRADALLISATLPPHLAAVAELIRQFRQRPELAEAKIIVGGRALQNVPDLWRSIGADSYAENADDCLVLLDRLVS
jgi:methanogenic corrinoid protein MtbC1